MNSYPLSKTHTQVRFMMMCLWAMMIVMFGLIICFGLFTRLPQSPLMYRLSHFDLILHCLAFSSLSIPAFLLFRPMIRVGLGIFALGLVVELAQWATPTREASLPDVAANTLGIVLAAMFVGILKKADISILRPILGKVA